KIVAPSRLMTNYWKLFLSQDDAEEIEKKNKVRPYVWHVSPRENRESILALGLRPNGGLVFATNASCIRKMYPFYLDYNWGELPLYDYWLIDTRSSGATWYRDPNSEFWICTQSAISPQHLQRYIYNPNECDE